MYKKSFFIVILALVMVGLGVTATGSINTLMLFGQTAPSKFDPGITVEEATKRSDKPLLIEFYSDNCGSCRQITPVVDRVKDKFKDDLQFVMVDVYDNRQDFLVDLFNIEVIPTVYVFDFKNMKKIQVNPRNLYTETDLEEDINKSLKAIGHCDKDAKTC